MALTRATSKQVTHKAAGGVVRNIFDKLSEIVSVKDFGAVGDGVADDTAAIQAAITSGKKVIFDKATYKVGTVVVENIPNISIDATGATFVGLFGNVFYFNNCDDFSWVGGSIKPATGVNPATSVPGTPTASAFPFVVYASDRVNVSRLSVENQPTYTLTSIVIWACNRSIVSQCMTHGGGDNSIWVFSGTEAVVANNTVQFNQRGRSICYQQVSRGSIVGNVVTNGFGDGINVHGSDNITITGNTVSDMAADTEVIGTARGISIEWDENATPALVAAAAADPFLYNKVFCRNITVSGNTVTNTIISVAVGNNSGITGASYGNQGVVNIVGNVFVNNSSGLECGTSTNITLRGNTFKKMALSFVAIDLGTDTGGYSASDIHIRENRFSQHNVSALGYSPIHFVNGASYLLSRNFIFTDNTFDTIASAAISNIATLNVNRGGAHNRFVEANAFIGYNETFTKQPQVSAQDGHNALASYFDVGASHEFTISGTVGDSFVDVFTMPANAVVIAELQIGSFDRMMQAGTFTAHNGSTPASSFNGIGTGYVQLSGSVVQIKGNTSAGAANYGGVFTIKFTVLKAI